MAGVVGTYPTVRVNWKSSGWHPGRTLGKVRPDGTIFTEVRFGMIKVRKYIHPDTIEPYHQGDKLCRGCGMINGKDYSNCNGCGKSLA